MDTVVISDLKAILRVSREYGRIQNYQAALSEMKRARGIIQNVIQGRAISRKSHQRWQSMLERADADINNYEALLKEQKVQINHNISLTETRPLAAERKNVERNDSFQYRSNSKRKNASNDRNSCNAEEIAEGDIHLFQMIEQDILLDHPTLSWDQIADLEEAKQVLQEAVIMPILMPHIFRGLRRPWKGVLLYGPPGTGKTLLAKAVASDCKSCFFNVSASSISSKFRGESEKLVRILFRIARDRAPSTIFIDEIDSIANARGGNNEHEASRRVKTELMVQMDGITDGNTFDKNQSRVIVIGATNTPWSLDEAIRRRFEKRIYIPLPSIVGREALFRINFKNTDFDEKSIDFKELANLTDGYSGADISNIARDGSMMSLRRVMSLAKQQGLSGASMLEYMENHEEEFRKVSITMNDMLLAIKRVGKSVGVGDLQKYSEWEKEYGSI